MKLKPLMLKPPSLTKSRFQTVKSVLEAVTPHSTLRHDVAFTAYPIEVGVTLQKVYEPRNLGKENDATIGA